MSFNFHENAANHNSARRIQQKKSLLFADLQVLTQFISVQHVRDIWQRFGKHGIQTMYQKQ